jgi:DNA modification methylase
MSRGRTLHPHQKPLALMERILRLSSEPGDMVWEPFGRLCTAALAASRLGRRCVAAEIRANVFRAAARRFEWHRVIAQIEDIPLFEDVP